jgi:hypothetical protein
MDRLWITGRKLWKRCWENQIRLCDEPKTRYQRILERPLVDDSEKERLRNTYNSINPVVLKKQIVSQLRLLLKNASVTSECEASYNSFGNNLI